MIDAPFQQPPAPGARLQPPLITLVIAAAVSPLAINIFVPSMPGMAQDFSTTYPMVQLGLSLYLIATALMQLVIGPLSDLLGRRPVIVAGMALFMIGTTVCLLAPTIEWFLAGRVIQAASASGMVLSRAIVRDVYAREKAASMIGYVTMGMSIAPMIGPAIGGILDEVFGWQASFIVLASLGAVSLLTLITTLPETNATSGTSLARQLEIYRDLVGSGGFWAFALTASLASGIFFAFLGGAPGIASANFAITPSAYGLWFALCALGYMSGNFLSGRYSERYGISRMIFAGAAFGIVGVSLTLTGYLTGVFGPVALFAPMMLVGLGNGMVLPNATAGAVSIRPDAAGAASGLLGSIQIGAGALFSILGGIVAVWPDGILVYCLLLVSLAIAGAGATWLAANAVADIS
jgi:DHA1 family bicyclomycin/chloramphenicol resistance-like MFS transporter